HADVPLPLLAFHEDGLQAPQVLPRLQVAFDRRRDTRDGRSDYLRPGANDDPRIQPLELLNQDLIEEEAGVTVSEPENFVAWEVGPAGVLSVADEGVLDGPSFRVEGSHDAPRSPRRQPQVPSVRHLPDACAGPHACATAAACRVLEEVP